jgi:outer membrane protein
MRKTGMAGIGIAVLAMVLFAGTSLAEGIKIAVVDVNKVLNESDEGKAAKKKMEARYEELKKTIDAKQEEAKKLKEEIDKQKVMLTNKEKLKEKEDALQAKVNELRKLTQEGEREMQGKQGELTRDVIKRIETQIDVVVKAEKYDLVLERNAGVVHVVESMDITAKVLALMNKAPKPAGAAKEPAEKKGSGAKKEAGGGK